MPTWRRTGSARSTPTPRPERDRRLDRAGGRWAELVRRGPGGELYSARSVTAPFTGSSSAEPPVQSEDPSEETKERWNPRPGPRPRRPRGQRQARCRGDLRGPSPERRRLLETLTIDSPLRSRGLRARPRGAAGLGGDRLRRPASVARGLRDWILENQDRLDRSMQAETRQGPRRRRARGLLLHRGVNFWVHRGPGYLADETMTRSPRDARRAEQNRLPPFGVVGNHHLELPVDPRRRRDPGARGGTPLSSSVAISPADLIEIAAAGARGRRPRRVRRSSTVGAETAGT